MSTKNSFDVTTREGWLNEFAFQLRMRNADGRVTGEQLALVETHLNDSGESPLEAFGDPSAYAATVLPRQRTRPADILVPALAGVGSYLGCILLLGGLVALAGGAATWALRLGDVVGVAVMLALVLWLSFAFGWVLKSRWGFAAWLVLAMLALVLPGVLLRRPLVELAAPVAAGLGALLVLVGAVTVAITMRRDPIRDPRQAAALAPLDAAEAGLVASGRPLEAMRDYRRRTGASLADAKAAVDRAGSQPAAG